VWDSEEEIDKGSQCVDMDEIKRKGDTEERLRGDL
jgi:hypothetical protein